MKTSLLLEDDFELEVELEFSRVKELAELRVRGAHSDVKVGHRQPNFHRHQPVGKNVGVQANGVLSNGLDDRGRHSSEDSWVRVWSVALLHGN